VYASRTTKEEFSGHDENCQLNASDLEGSLVTSSRLQNDSEAVSQQATYVLSSS